MKWRFYEGKKGFGHLGLESSRVLLVEPGSSFSRTLPSSAHSSGDHSVFSSALEEVEVVKMMVEVVVRNFQDHLQDSG